MKTRSVGTNTSKKSPLGLRKATMLLVCQKVLDEIRDMQIFTEMRAHRLKINRGKSIRITAKITRDLPIIIKDAIRETFIVFIRVVKKIRDASGNTVVFVRQKRLSFPTFNPAMVAA